MHRSTSILNAVPSAERAISCLQNKTPQPIAQIHLTDAQQSVTNVAFDRPFHIVSGSARNLYTIYALDKPLAPGETMNMTFNVGKESRGFMDGHERAELAYNGTFFDSGYFPSIGYVADNELGDPRRRREEHLGAQELLPNRGDPVGSVTNLFTPQSDWVHYRTTVSTSADQIAISPGYLTEGLDQPTDVTTLPTTWARFRLSTSYPLFRVSTKSLATASRARTAPLPSMSIIFLRTAFDVQDMIDASKTGLAFYEKAFSPFQFKQYRILEFPRYRSFAQSFPNTVPFSEGIGFIERMEKPTDIDFTYFVTAHELGASVVGASVDWRPGCRIKHDVGNAGGILRADDDAASLRR